MLIFNKDVDMEIVIYGKKNCPNCDKAKALLESKEIPYEYVDISECSAIVDTFKQNGWKTVPQVFKGGVRVGGFQELKDSLILD